MKSVHVLEMGPARFRMLYISVAIEIARIALTQLKFKKKIKISGFHAVSDTEEGTFLYIALDREHLRQKYKVIVFFHEWLICPDYLWICTLYMQ